MTISQPASQLTLYLYEVYDPKRSTTIRGSWFAPTEDKARFWLEHQGFLEIRLRRSSLSQQTLRVHPTALALFFRQLATLMQTGTPLPFALRLVSHSQDQRLSAVAQMLESHVASGQYLSNAMSAFPLVFDRVNVGLVAAGESSGRLAVTLLDIANAEESRVALRGRVIASLTYPLVLATFTFGVTALFVFYVLPLDNAIFGSMGIELPWPNRVLLSFVNFLKSPWLPFGLLSAGGAFWAVARKETHRRRLGELVVRLISLLPATRALLQKGRAVRLLQILTLALTSGGTVQHALKLMLAAYADQPVQKGAIERLRNEVVNGADFGVALDSSGLFPRIVGALLRIGYETGRLERMSQRAMEICEEDVRLGLETMSSLIEPILLGFAGLVATGVVLTAAMPMLKMIQSL